MGGQCTSSVSRVTRIAGLTLHLLQGALTIGCVFPFLNPRQRKTKVKRWSQRLLHVCGVRLHVHGQLPRASDKRSAMLVANHVSWLDIVVIDAVLPARFVAKSEIRRWPLIGWMSARAGTLFIERARRRDTARIARQVSDALLSGDVCAVFPEGTTTDGSNLLAFHSSLLQSALLAGADVFPVALRFERADKSLCTEAAFDGDKTLWQAVRAVVSQTTIHAHIWFLDPIPVAALNRRALALSTRDAIARRLTP